MEGQKRGREADSGGETEDEDEFEASRDTFTEPNDNVSIVNLGIIKLAIFYP